MFDLNKLVRKHIKNIKPAISLRERYSLKILLDKNENKLGSPLPKWYNIYPDNAQKIKDAVASVKRIDAENIFTGNDIEECADLVLRIFCEPQKDNAVICLPANNFFETCANINDTPIRKILLLEDFQLDLIHLENIIDENTKLIFISSPNEASGISLSRNDVEMLLNNFKGLVVIDESYINFSRYKSFLQELNEYPNLIVLQTFSKAWGLAGLRLGAAFAAKEIIELLEKIKIPYNINIPTEELALKAIDKIELVNEMIVEIISMRNALAEVLKQFPFVENIFPSDGNFLLVKMKNAKAVFEFLLMKDILVNDKTNEPLCENCLRITTGNEKENTMLVDALIEYLNSMNEK